MIKIDVRADIAAAKHKIAQARSDIVDKATVSALNKTIAKANTEMVRAVTQEYAISAAEVRGRLRVFRASRGKLTAILDPFASGRRPGMNLIHFVEKKTTMADARRRAKAGTLDQLHFQVKRVGGKKVIKGAFIGNKGRTVFVREGKARLPIKALTTVGVPQMFNTKRINARVTARVRQEFPIEMQRALGFYLSKMGAR